MSAKTRVATAGAGYFSQYQYEAWTRMDDVEVVAVCNRTEANAREIADKYGIPDTFTDFAEMLDGVRPDLVDIITPPVTHLDYIRIAAERRVPTICQKPFCRTPAEADDILTRCGKHAVRIAVASWIASAPPASAPSLVDAIGPGCLAGLFSATCAVAAGAPTNRAPIMLAVTRTKVRASAWRSPIAAVSSTQTNPTIPFRLTTATESSDRQPTA